MNDGHRTSTIPRPKAREVAAPVRTPPHKDRTKATRRSRSRGGASGGPGGGSRRGSRDAPRPDPRPPARADRPSIISDFTTPIERTKQLVPQKRGRLVVALFSVVIALAIGAALFVLPVKSWIQQRDDLAIREGELATLDAANDQLQLEVERLQTDAGIREAARTEIDFVEAGEQRLTVLPATGSATVLPTGWPYNLISGIVALRQAEASTAAAEAVAATAPETTTAPTSVETTLATTLETTPATTAAVTNPLGDTVTTNVAPDSAVIPAADSGVDPGPTTVSTAP